MSVVNVVNTVTVKRSGPAAERPRALVLLDPRGAFTSVAVRPMSGLMFAVMLAFSLAPPLAFLSKVDTSAFVEREIKKSGKADAIPEAQREQAVTTGAKFMKIVFPVGALVKRAMWISVLAALCFAFLRAAKPDLKIEPLLAATALAMAPLAFRDVIVAITFLSKDVMALDAQNPVLANPAAWLGMEIGKSASAAALKGLDFFDLWSCTLVGLGINVVAGTRSWSPYLVAFGAQLATVALGVATAAVS